MGIGFELKQHVDAEASAKFTQQIFQDFLLTKLRACQDNYGNRIRKTSFSIRTKTFQMSVYKCSPLEVTYGIYFSPKVNAKRNGKDCVGEMSLSSRWKRVFHIESQVCLLLRQILGWYLTKHTLFHPQCSICSREMHPCEDLRSFPVVFHPSFHVWRPETRHRRSSEISLPL